MESSNHIDGIVNGFVDNNSKIGLEFPEYSQ